MPQPAIDTKLANTPFKSISTPESHHVPNGTETETVTSNEEVSEYVLLTPPAQNESSYPLTSIEPLSFNSHTPSQLTRALHENVNARAHNSNITIVPSTQTHISQDASNLLHGLTITTDMARPHRSGSAHSIGAETRLRSSSSLSNFPRRAPSVRTALHSTAGSLSPGSVTSSPQIAAMLDITPLPSPTMSAFEMWKSTVRTRSRGSSASSRSDLPSTFYQSASISPPSPRRKGYQGLSSPVAKTSEDLGQLPDDSKHQTRSISEYVPEALALPKPRNVAVSGSGFPPGNLQAHEPMVREEYLGVQRGLVAPEEPDPQLAFRSPFPLHDEEPVTKRPRLEVFAANSIYTGQTRHYESIRELGQGTFSKVYLAVRQVEDRHDSVDYRQDSVNLAGVRARSRRLAAVKVVAQGPAGGADAERIEISLKREVDLLKQIKHPSLVHLKAFGVDGNSRSLLVMNYCPGGDLFDLANTKLDVLTPPLVRRIFSELVSAVRYLHQKFIVHRDIKLENVLLNIPLRVHADVPDWQSLDRAVVTLTDLGLSRRIPEPPENPLLTTRCGSEDYAAPEILMGQPYDGRQTDAWALGVLLYALMEGRLPFDPLPGSRGDPATLRARTPHRIARCEWAWVKYGDADGDWDSVKGKDFSGAFTCVDGLLKRNTRRKPLAEIRDLPWVKDGIQIDGGLRWVEEEAM